MKTTYLKIQKNLLINPNKVKFATKNKKDDMEKKFGSILDLDEDTVTIIVKDDNKYNMKLNLFQTAFEQLREDKRSKLLDDTLFHSIKTLMDFVEYYNELKGKDGLLREEFNVLLNGEPIIFVITTGLLNYWTIISEVIDDDELTYIEKIEKLDLIRLNILQSKLVAEAKFGGDETEITKNYPVIEQLIENQKTIFEKLANSNEKIVVSEIFKQKFEYIVENIFDNEKIIQVLNEIGYERESSYKDLMIKEFKKRDINEWMKYYEKLDKTSQLKTLKEHHLPIEDHTRNQNKILNAVYETSDIGRETKANLEKFESKYIRSSYDYQQSDNKILINNKPVENKSKNILFNQDKIFNEIEKLDFESQIPFIKKTLSDIEMKYGKDLSTAPMQIRMLETNLINREMINRGLESLYGATKTKDDNSTESKENEMKNRISNSVESMTIVQKKAVPTKGLKALGKTICEKLISDKRITTVLNETKTNKAITNLVIPEIEKEYNLTIPNKKSLQDYFRQGKLTIKNNKGQGLIVLDTYPKKQNK